MASIFKNGKYWRAQIRRKDYPAISKTFDTKAEALQWASQIEGQLEIQTPEQVIQRLSARDLTLKAAFDKYLLEVMPSKKPGTQLRETSFIRWWQKSIWQTTPLPSFTSTQLAAAIRGMEKEGRAANTMRLHIAVLSHLYTIARKEWGFTDLVNPVELIRKPKPGEARDRRLVGNEEERILAACGTKNPELADIVVIAIETAMRQGEIFALDWKWIDWTKHTIKLPAEVTKTRKGRTIPLSHRAEETLLRQQDRRKKALFDQHRVWSYQTQDGIRASFFKAIRAIGISDLHFHDLRHEATSRLFEQGSNAAVVQAITGHQTAQMLQRYTHLSGESLVKAIRGEEPKALATPVEPAPPPPAAPSSKRPKFCPQCGSPVETAWRFCEECGLSLYK